MSTNAEKNFWSAIQKIPSLFFLTYQKILSGHFLPYSSKPWKFSKCNSEAVMKIPFIIQSHSTPHPKNMSPPPPCSSPPPMLIPSPHAHPSPPLLIPSPHAHPLPPCSSPPPLLIPSPHAHSLPPLLIPSPPYATYSPPPSIEPSCNWPLKISHQQGINIANCLFFSFKVLKVHQSSFWSCRNNADMDQISLRWNAVKDQSDFTFETLFFLFIFIAKVEWNWWKV